MCKTLYNYTLADTNLTYFVTLSNVAINFFNFLPHLTDVQYAFLISRDLSNRQI